MIRNKIIRIGLVSSLVIWSPALIALLIWNKLPDQIPTHFNNQMIADNWSSKPVAFFATPLILTIAQFFVIFIVLKDPQNKNLQSWIARLIFSIIPITSLFIFTVTFLKVTHTKFYGLENNLLNLLIGILFIALGLILKKVKPNYTIGIRLPWTLDSEENWKLTHKLGAKTFIIGGMFILLFSFIQINFLFLPIIIVVILVPCVYSYLLYKKGI